MVSTLRHCFTPLKLAWDVSCQKIAKFTAKNTNKKWVAVTTKWLSWLETSWGDSGYEKLILVLEANCISNLSPNLTLTTDNPQNICEGVTTTTIYTCICFWQLVALSRFRCSMSNYYIFKIMAVIACSLIQVSMSPIQRCNWTSNNLWLSNAISKIYST